MGSGGIKPCVIAFGGDQFKLPEQVKQLATFFSLFYFAVNSGSLISTTITPILREDVNCFGEEGCFSLAFGVPAVLMTVSIVIFVIGKFMYIIKKPSGNMLVLVSKCIGVSNSSHIFSRIFYIMILLYILERNLNPQEGEENQSKSSLVRLRSSHIW